MKEWSGLKMKKTFSNLGYFLREAKTLIKLNLMSNVLSVISTGLIFFIFAMVVSGWWISSQVIQLIQDEAEINIYFDENLGDRDVLLLLDRINEVEGVREARKIEQDEAHNRMVDILGKEAEVLKYFDESPFSPFIEAGIDIDKIDSIIGDINSYPGINHIRDNREVLYKIHDITRISKALGYLVVLAVGITTLMIISHITRQGIYNNKEQINTLRLLGAPETFIATPFLMGGFLLNLAGGILASVLSGLTLKEIYFQMAGPLPFIPLPPRRDLVSMLVSLTIVFSGGLGILGSFVGLVSLRNN